MTKFKLVPIEPTREMWAAAGDAVVALKSQHHDAISEAVYKAMLAAAPVQGEPVAWLRFRSHRVAADDVIEGLEICEPGEIGDDGGPAFPVYAALQPAEPQPIGHDWDDQDKCRRCGDRDWYASATCTPKQQPTPDVSALVEALKAELETVKKVAYGNIELLEQNEALQAECDALVEALESILHGSLLDACGNRDDDGISSAITMGIQRDSLQRWRKIARQALATLDDNLIYCEEEMTTNKPKVTR